MRIIAEVGNVAKETIGETVNYAHLQQNSIQIKAYCKINVFQWWKFYPMRTLEVWKRLKLLQEKFWRLETLETIAREVL